MNVTTKFDLGQQVVKINNHTPSIAAKCEVCDGTGRVDVPKHGPTSCPKCHGHRTYTVYPKTQWNVFDGGTIGNLRLSLYHRDPELDPEMRGTHDDERQYMLYETGIGSGTLHYERDLFLTREEAQLECDRRNAITP